MTQRISPEIRADVLKYASMLTTRRKDPVAVAVNASPLLAWLEAADGEDDLTARLTAMRRHHVNLLDADPFEANLAEGGDDPDSFVAAAVVYHAFMTAGDPDAVTNEELKELSA